MARDDGFRRYLELGTALLDMTQQRAEALVKDLVKAGDVSKGKAEKAINDLLERSRKTTDDLRAIIRREIADQVQTLGLATKDDIARLEARIVASPAPAAESGSPASAARSGSAAAAADAGRAEAASRPVRKGAPINKAATTAAPSRSAPTKRKSTTKKAARPTSPGPVPADSPDLRPSSGSRPDGDNA